MYKILFVLSIFLASCSTAKQKPVIVTSIAPFANYLDKIVGNFYQVINIAGNTATAEDIDLSLKDTEIISKGLLYFSFDLPFEKEIMSKNIISKDNTVQLIQAIDMITFRDTTEQISSELHHSSEGDHHHHGHHSHSDYDLDPHIWVSPKQMIKLLVKSIEELGYIHPEYKQKMLDNFLPIQQELEQLDKELIQKVQTLQHKEFLVFHPAYGYLAKDYGLKQIAIEKEGKETSLKDMLDVVTIIKEHHISTLFLQTEYPQSVINGLEKETQVKVIRVNPLDKNYAYQIRLMIKGFSDNA